MVCDVASPATVPSAMEPPASGKRKNALFISGNGRQWNFECFFFLEKFSGRALGKLFFSHSTPLQIRMMAGRPTQKRRKKFTFSAQTLATQHPPKEEKERKTIRGVALSGLHFLHSRDYDDGVRPS